MSAFSELLDLALKHHRAGETRQAEEVCRHILRDQPYNADALHLLGVLAQQSGRAEEARVILGQAVALCPDNADCHYNLGVAQQTQGYKAEALASYRQALRLNPDHVLTLNNIGHLALNLDQVDEAEEYLRRALRVRPDHGSAYHNLALVCKRRGKLDEAVACLHQALQLLPDDATIPFQLGRTLEERGQMDEALAAFEDAVRLQPDNAEFRCWLGNSLTKKCQPRAALPHYEMALRLEPDSSAYHSNLGNVLTQLGRPQEGETHCREAIRLHPDAAVGHYNLANALAAQGRLDEALRTIEEALRIEPELPGGRASRALWWLQQGRFAEGWPEYEWRWKLPERVADWRHTEPLWDGSPLNGKTILLWSEQGMGDTLQAVRFAPLVKQRGGVVVVECQTPLAPLLSRCAGIDHLAPHGASPPAADVQAPLMSLPRILGITLETLPAAEFPYLFADPALIEQWRAELAGPPRLKIGIAWQGNPLFSSDSMRSIPLKHFAALARLPGVRLFSLQKGTGSEQLQTAAEQFYVVDLGPRLDGTTGAFMDTAAVMQNLDLVVTSDTSVAHLAGGLGVPVWVALSLGCDWRFLLHREDSPWYPSMRLFRQKHFGDWDEVFARIADELSGRAGGDGEASVASASGSSPADLAQLWGRALTHIGAEEHKVAEQICRQLLDAEPCHAEALNTLGVLAQRGGQNELARQHLERAVALRPQDAGFHYNLAVARQVLGQAEEAIAGYRQTLRLQPEHASALNNLGYALFALGQDVEARTLLEQAVRLQPDNAEAHINLGSAYLRQGELHKAEASLKQAAQLRPDHDGAQSRLGIALQRQGRLDEALVHFHKAVQLAPNSVAAHHNNLGLTLAALGRYEDALDSYEQAIRLDSESKAHFSRALIWLLRGDFERGWREYEYRWQSLAGPRPSGPQPLWDGSTLNGQTILLWAEQGLGDTIQFIRYASPIKQRGGAVVLQCPAKLTRLLSGCLGVDRVVSQDESLPSYDVQAPLLSLPRILGTTLETIPANVPYLFANNDLVQRWQRELSSVGGFRVGIAWQGDPGYLLDHDRSIPLHHFAPLARVAGVRLISLQKGPGVEQLGEASKRFPALDLGPRLDETDGAFTDTAAAMKCLDLVVTSDTAVAHLAGALGVPVWLALTFAPEWRWLLHREDSPWYPTMRLFRQSRRGDWEGVFIRMADELRGKVGRSASVEVLVPIAPGELIDKITILEIKTERIRDAIKLANVRAELAELRAARERCLPNSAELARLTSALKAVNEALWQIEDDLRDCERAGDFGPRFIQLARSVYQHNDRRAALKHVINDLLGSRIIEEKSYSDYAASEGCASTPRSYPAPLAPTTRTDGSDSAHHRKRTGRLAAICILTFGDYLAYFQRCLESVLANTPWDAFELRLGFNAASQSWDYARQRVPAEGDIEIAQLPGSIERWSYQAVGGLPVSLWNSPMNLYKEPMCRLLYHNRPLTTEYAVWFDDDSYVEQGWWEALAHVLDRRVDYIGQPWWVYYFPGQTDMIRAQPWYRGVPFETHNGKDVVQFFTGGFMAVRAERLREAQFPDTTFRWQGDTLKQYGGDTLLGEIARQQGWTRAAHDAFTHVNVDLFGRHPAPRRGGTGRQFGSDIDAGIENPPARS